MYCTHADVRLHYITLLKNRPLHKHQCHSFIVHWSEENAQSDQICYIRDNCNKMKPSGSNKIYNLKNLHVVDFFIQTNKQTEKKERKKQKKNKCKILISSIFFSLLLRFCILVQLKLNVDRLLKANDDKIFTTYEWNHTPMGLNNQMLLRITQHIHCTDVHWSDTFFAL